MTIEQLIMGAYGVRLRRPPIDGVIRSFAINQLHNGFIVAFPDCACFGSWIYGECCVLNGGGESWFELIHKSSKDIRAEWLIWEIARSMLERGERLNAVDAERLALAVQRLEAWL